MNIAERIYYNGYWINIYYDELVDSPSEWGDGGLFLVHYHRDCWIEEKEYITKDEIADWYRGENEEIEERYWIWPVSAYIHSGVVLSIGSGRHFPDQQWDVSHVGAVLASKEEFEDEEKAHQACESLVELWNDYLSGNIYGYYLENEENNSIECGCSGYYGDYEKSGLLDEAKKEIDREIEERCKDSIEEYKQELEIIASLQPTEIY